MKLDLFRLVCWCTLKRTTHKISGLILLYQHGKKKNFYETHNFNGYLQTL